MSEEYLKQIAENTAEANEKLEAIHEALELGSKVGVTGAEAPPSYVTESYLRRQLEVNVFARAILDIMADLVITPHPLKDKQAVINADYWLTSGKLTFAPDADPIFPFHHYPTKVSEMLGLKITSRFYAPGGEVVRGDPQDITDDRGTTGQYTTIRNGGSTDLEHGVDKTVTLEHTQSSQLEKGIQLDLTAKEGASYAGVNAELEEHLGITENQTDATSDSKTSSTTFSDKAIVPAGAEETFVYSKQTKRFTQPYSINANADVAFSIHAQALEIGSTPRVRGVACSWYLFNHENQAILAPSHDPDKPPFDLSFQNIHDFCGFVRGYDARAPQMRFYIGSGRASARALAALAILEDATNMHLVLSGVDTLVIDADADYQAIDVKGVSDAEIHERYGKEGLPLSPNSDPSYNLP